MRDAVFIALVIAFFAVTFAYVQACGWIVGPDEQTTPLVDPAEAPEPDEVAA